MRLPMFIEMPDTSDKRHSMHTVVIEDNPFDYTVILHSESEGKQLYDEMYHLGEQISTILGINLHDAQFTFYTKSTFASINNTIKSGIINIIPAGIIESIEQFAKICMSILTNADEIGGMVEDDDPAQPCIW